MLEYFNCSKTLWVKLILIKKNGGDNLILWGFWSFESLDWYELKKKKSHLVCTWYRMGVKLQWGLQYIYKIFINLA